jgi:calcium-binding protein CML
MGNEPTYASEAARIAAQMDDRRREQMREVFKSLDENGDGLLQPAELTSFLESLGYLPANADAETRKILEQWDSDGDGTISFDEFVASQVRPNG